MLGDFFAQIFALLFKSLTHDIEAETVEFQILAHKLSNRDFFVFDEFLIQQALDRLVEGRTTFAIAHRLSTLRGADRLVVIDKHSIAEIGTHNELLEKKGIYYNLVTAQLKMAEGK